MTRKITAIVCLMCLLVGCMGKTPMMVDTFQYGDDKRSCEDINRKIMDLNDKIEALYKKRQDKISANVAMGAIGMVLFFPALFLIDSKSDELLEVESCLERRKVLCQIVRDNGCKCTVESNEDFLARIDREAPEKIRNQQSNTDRRKQS